MSKQFAVVGLGRFGLSVARGLAEGGAEVLAIDRNLDLVEEVAADVSHAVCFDATQKAHLESHAIGEMDGVIVAIGENFEANVMVTTLAKEVGASFIVARAYNNTQRRILGMVGATEVVNPEEDIGRRLARGLVSSDIIDFVDLPEGYQLREHTVESGDDGKSLATLLAAGGERILAVALRRES
ncbi:MAG TPA: TrkA family potassium uptake protein, partial [Candidatus Krumholzibacteria bacterium]